MAVFLTILKIIGIVIASIIGLVVLILLLILMPFFTYKINIVKNEEFLVKFIVTYPLSIFKAVVSYDDEGPFITVRLFGIKVYRKNIIDLINGGDDELDSELEGMDVDLEADMSLLEKESEAEFVEKFDSVEQTDDFEEKSAKSKWDTMVDAIKDFVSKITEKWYTLKDNVEELKKKIDYYIRYIKYYYKVINYKSMEPAMEIVKKTIVDLVKHIKPRKIYGNIDYGNDDPGKVAKMYGYYSLGYPYYGDGLVFNSHFDEDIFSCDVTIKGHFQLFRIVFIALRAVSNKHLRTMIRLFKGEGMKRGRK